MLPHSFLVVQCLEMEPIGSRCSLFVGNTLSSPQPQGKRKGISCKTEKKSETRGSFSLFAATGVLVKNNKQGSTAKGPQTLHENK